MRAKFSVGIAVMPVYQSVRMHISICMRVVFYFMRTSTVAHMYMHIYCVLMSLLASQD